MSKTLLIIRHAKSSWDDLSQLDFERKLNDRGKIDAPRMAKLLRKEKNIILDAIISSPAKRAFSTAKIFAEEFGLKKKAILLVDYLYEPSVEDFYKAIEEINDHFNEVALFSHNPGITAFVNQLTPVQIDNMPTCGVFALNINADSWRDFHASQKHFLFFEFPKNIT